MFFVKQRTAYERRISDWSSDVCSSDLADPIARREDHVVSAADEPEIAFLVDIVAVTGQVPAVLENRLGAYGITPVAQKQAWRPPAGCTLRDISFHPWRKPCSRLIDHGQIAGRRRAAHRPSPGHARPIGAPKNRFGLALAVVDIKTRSGLPKNDTLGAERFATAHA